MHRLTFDTTKTILYEEVTSYGLKVLIAPIENTEVTYGGVYVETGALRHEDKLDNTKNIQGTANYLSKVLHRTSLGDIKEKIEDYGAKYDVQIDYSSTVYSFSTVSDYKECLDLVLSLCTNMTLTESNVDEKRTEIIQELEKRTKEQYELLKNEVLNNLYFSSPIKEDVIGSEDNIKNIHLSNLKKYFSSKYTLENLTVFIVGKVDPEEMHAYLESRKLVLEKRKEVKRSEYVNKEEYGQVVKSNENLLLSNSPSSAAIGIKFLPRMELFERYGDSVFSVYELLPLLLKNCLIEKCGLNDNLKVEVYEGGEDSYLYIYLPGVNDDRTLNEIKSTLGNLAKCIKRKQLKKMQKLYFSEHIKDFASPERYFNGLVHAYENHIAYPAMVERVYSLPHKVLHAFLKDMQSWMYSVVTINKIEGKE